MTGYRIDRLLPRSLFGQTLLILLVGLLASHAIGAWIYAGAREQAVRAIGGFSVAQRIANLSRLVDESPADWRARIVQALNDPTFSVSLSSSAPGDRPADPTGAADAIQDAVRQQLPDRSDWQVRVSVTGATGSVFGGPGFHRPSADMAERMRGRMGMGFGGPGFGAWRALEASVRLGDGQWLIFATALPQSGPALSWQFAIAFAIMALIVLAVSIWAVRRMTAPLGLMAQAADRLRRDVTAAPLVEAGTSEMRDAARAFNRMQDRLRRLIESRTHMLAALSHDLRTPLTLLRLRTEEIAQPDERDRMLATIAEMDSMIGETLAFARDEARAEPRRRVDVAALLASVVDDLADAGLPADMKPSAALPYECQPAALKRAIANLLDNALKYGARAHAAIIAAGDAVEIVVEDEGPGILEDELPKVFQPFYRIEDSRSRETGGSGLGLAIAQSIAQAHGGEIVLANRTGGGLRACIRLPF